MEIVKKTAFKCRLFLPLLFLFSLYSCEQEQTKRDVKTIQENTPATTANISYSLVATYKHDSTAYTEGLQFHEGQLYESTGGPLHLPETRSAIGTIDLNTGKFISKVEIDRTIYFGEGMLILKNLVYQLTYTNQVGFIYDLKSFNRVGQFSIQNKEGWGMTTDGEFIIFSDGTCNLTYLDPKDFRQIKVLPVIENGYGLYNINELEYIKGFIYANVWLTNRIVKIDPNTGNVVGALDISKLFEKSRQRYPKLNETNGIAYDSISDKILVTGKLWPEMYQISFPH